MKSKFIAFTLFVCTAATVAFYPAYQSIGAGTRPLANQLHEQRRVEVCALNDQRFPFAQHFLDL